MIRFIFGLILVGGAFILWKWVSSVIKARKALEEKGRTERGDYEISTFAFQILKTWVAGALLVLGIFLFLSTSFVIVGQDEVGHLNKIYGFKSMPPGQIIAVNGQKGPQAEVLPPGFHLSPFIRVLNQVKMESLVEIKPGFCGKITALDGSPLREGQVFADEWLENEFEKMLNAEYFLTKGGQKGPQISVLKPGKYRLNKYLFNVTETRVTNVDAGYVGVIKSNVQQVKEDVNAVEIKKTAGGLVARVVPKGYKGVWKTVFYPGQYYLNDDAFQVIPIDTRVQTWAYIGGFLRRYIDLKLDQNGNISQTERQVPFDKQPEAADDAITVRIEGWEIPLDSRILVQVDAEKAPYVVASVGTIEEIENDIITPTYRSIQRNVCGREDRKALDLIYKRAELEDLVEKEMIIEGEKAFITIKEVRFGEPAYPPELMIARLREQLAEQLKDTYAKEQIAQVQRIETEKARAIADQQPKLIEADIEKQAATFRKDASKLMGEGEKLRLMEIAEGQKAQAAVLGQDKVLQLAMLKEILEAAVKNPDIVKVPSVFVQGTTTGFEGAAAVLGSSNIMSAFRQQPTKTEQSAEQKK